MTDDEEDCPEVGAMARYDAGLLISIAVVLLVYVLFFAFVFTEPPNLPSGLPRKMPDPPRRLQ
jgi:hypothetical protein